MLFVCFLIAALILLILQKVHGVNWMQTCVFYIQITASCYRKENDKKGNKFPHFTSAFCVAEAMFPLGYCTAFWILT